MINLKDLYNWFTIKFSKGRNWIFHIPTRGLELTNASMAIFFALVIFLNKYTTTEINLYKNIGFPYDAVWLTMFTLAVIQITNQNCDALHCKLTRSLIAKIFSFLWLVIGYDFYHTFGLNTSSTTAFILIIVNLFVGFEISAQTKIEEIKEFLVETKKEE